MNQGGLLKIANVSLHLVNVMVATLWPMSINAAELLFNPREVSVQRFIAGQSPTLVTGEQINVRALPTVTGNGGFVFARLDEGDSVYVLSCEGYAEGYFWVRVWIPEIGETGYVVAEFLQNNYQWICERTRDY